MKKQIILQISKLTITVLATLTVSAGAQESECGMSTDSLTDTQQLADKIYSPNNCRK